MGCKQIKFDKTKICAGDRRHRITIYERNITPPTADGVDFDEELSNAKTYWAAIKTRKGVVVFDSANTERDVTHSFFIVYDENITQEYWLRFNQQNYDILNVINIDGENRFLELQCSLTGSTYKESTKA